MNRYSVAFVSIIAALCIFGTFGLMENVRAARAAEEFQARTFTVKMLYAVDWDEKPLSEVVDWYGEQLSQNVLVDWTSLNAAGIEQDTPVTLTLSNVSLGSILDNALKLVSDVPLRYHTVDDITMISTKTHWDQIKFIRVYSVADLLHRIPNFKGPTISLDNGGQSTGSENPFSGSEGTDDEDDKGLLDIKELADLIRSVIEPDSWRENGGDNTIRPWRGVLVVRAPIEIQEIIGGPYVWTKN